MSRSLPRSARLGAVLAVAAAIAMAVVVRHDAEPTAAAGRAQRVQVAERMVWDRYGAKVELADGALSEAQALADMIAHHRDAIDGSQAVLATTTSPAVAEFARRVVRVQSAQLAQMDAWLAEWYPGLEPTAGWAPMFADPATTATDDAYLATMVSHHEHAITMYAGWVAAGVVEHDDLGLLAARIAQGQEGEIAFMRQLGG